MPAPVIEISGLVKEFRADFWKRRVRVLDGVNLTVEKGDVFGFLGPNGAGKTTTLKILMGLVFPTSGSLKLFGEHWLNVELKRRIGFLPENPYFYEYLNAFEFLSFYADLFGLRGKEKQKRIDYLLELVGMTRYRNLQLRKFSKGMLQRIGLAQALINDPELVVLDEPQTGLDPIGRHDVRQIILHLKEEGKTVFFSSHVMPDVEMICEKVAIMMRGKIHDVGRLDQLLSPKTHYFEVLFKKCDPKKIKAKFDHRRVGGDDIAKVTTEAQLNALIKEIYRLKGVVIAVTPHTETLEELFMHQVKMTNSRSTSA